jgi:hypothetical protein
MDAADSDFVCDPKNLHDLGVRRVRDDGLLASR